MELGSPERRLEEREAELERRAAALERGEQALASSRSEVDQQRVTLDERERSLTESEANLREQEAELEKQDADAREAARTRQSHTKVAYNIKFDAKGEADYRKVLGPTIKAESCRQAALKALGRLRRGRRRSLRREGPRCRPRPRLLGLPTGQ